MITQPISDILETARFDITKHYQESAPLLSLCDIPILTRGNISSIVGAPKSRKSFLATLIAGAFLSSKLYDFSAPCANNKVLWVDTEQATRHCSKVYQRVNILRGNYGDCQQADFILLMLRDLSPKDRFSLTKDAIDRYKPDLVIIDGIADLLDSNNDETSASKLQDFLLSTTKQRNCHIVNVIHSNIGSEKARGHTGANLIRKSETIMSVIASENASKVSFSSRDIQPNAFAFCIDNEGIPILCEIPNKKKISNMEMLKSILAKNERLSYYDLVNRIMDYRFENDNPISEARAKQIITQVYKEKAIKRINNEYALAK